jgi:uncharacterized protein (TIGR02646 family)
MIRIQRGPEPSALTALRTAKLHILRNLGREPTSSDITGYGIVGDVLWRAQHCKCCYCEHRIPKSFNDVEHYRPKSKANRAPGCMLTHGYWWLAYSWENLLYSCPSCNRSNKNANFPTRLGSVSLVAETQPFDGQEIPLLIDPAETTINPVDHIQYVPIKLGFLVQWIATSRNGSIQGAHSVQCYGLNDQEKIELRGLHVDTIKPFIDSLLIHLNCKNVVSANEQYFLILSFLHSRCSYICLTFDALHHYVPDDFLFDVIGKRWPLTSLLPL